MLIVTTDHIAGRNIEMLGLVKGSTIQTVHMGKDIMNGFKTLVGGELSSYNEMTVSYTHLTLPTNREV